MNQMSKNNYYLFMFLLIYPILNIVVSYLSNGNNMNKFSQLYCIIVYFLILFNKRIELRDCVILFLSMVILPLTLLRETFESGYFAVQFINICFAYILFSNKYFPYREITKLFCDNYIKVISIQMLFFGVILIHFLQYGLHKAWMWGGIPVLQASYNMPHTLAYLLFFLAIADIIIYIKQKSNVALLLLGITAILILLTSVRTVLVSMIIPIFILFIHVAKKESFTKKCLLAIVILLFTSISIYYGVIENIVTKSLSALDGGDITNSRFKIFTSSINCLYWADGLWVIKVIFGIGMGELLLLNSQNPILLYAAIHGHSDFVDAMVCYGVLGLFVYIYSLYCFFYEKRLLVLSTTIVLAFSNGLFTYIECIPLLYLIGVLDYLTYKT